MGRWADDFRELILISISGTRVSLQSLRASFLFDTAAGFCAATGVERVASDAASFSVLRFHVKIFFMVE